MRKSLVLFLLICACCAHRLPSSAGQAPSDALLERADTYKAAGRYLEALSLYRDIAMNPAWAERAGAPLYLNMAALYRDYLGDAVQADLWYGRYRTHVAGAPAAPAIDKRVFAADQPMPACIRVLVADNAEPVRIASVTPLKISGGKAEAISAGPTIVCSADNTSIIVNNGAPIRGPVRVTPADNQSVSMDGNAYRGLLTLTAAKGRLLVVNHIPLDDYLCGVLPREMAPSWPLEALKAQAVAARTYAVYHMLLRRTAAYDVLSTTSSQVYGGSEKDYPAVRSAVDATRGLVLAEGGRLALTLFHANSGGRTESLEDIWGGRLSYLSSVDDPFSKNYSGGTWEKTLSAEEIASACAQFGIAADKVKEIVPIERSASGRIKKLKVVADSQTFFLSGNSFRLIVGPGKVKGTNFAVQKEKAEFVFKGTGYGHGAGMSQWGAYGMSKKGHDFTAILGHYYPG
ncbi:MAG: SpoIID/LytB domain-containing protein, partial [Proteobacteria bacterium]|nr:SpoIID/LytB domain-containing protein [Pseudomonadota bacterium]